MKQNERSVRGLLTRRQQQALQLRVYGLHYADIAVRLTIDKATVSVHLRNARRNLSVATIEDAIAIALQRQLVSPPCAEIG